MNVLIAYAGKYGSTERCAKEIAGLLNAKVDLVDLGKGKEPKASNYDMVVLGSSIRFGRIHKNMKDFIDHQASDIKKCAVFLTALMPENEKQYYSENFSKQLLSKVVEKNCFGGVIGQENFFDKLIIWLVTKEPKSNLSFQKMDEFTKNINHAIEQ